MHIKILFMTRQFFFNSQERDVSLLVETAEIKSNQKRMQVIHLGHIVYINKISGTPQIVLLFGIVLMTF